MPDDVPQSVRVRTGGENEWRYRSIERAARLYDKNRSDSVAYACEDVVGLVDALEEVLGREDLTARQRREIAETVDRATSGVSVEVDVLDVHVGAE